jgi:hypothetical protein
MVKEQFKARLSTMSDSLHPDGHLMGFLPFPGSLMLSLSKVQ